MAKSALPAVVRQTLERVTSTDQQQLFVHGMPRPDDPTVDLAASLAQALGRTTTAEHAALFVERAQVTSADLFVDLGCGDAEALGAVARLSGARCVGVELDASLVREARRRVKSCGAAVRIVHDDVLHYDLRGATTVYVFLTSFGISVLAQKLCTELKPGARVITRMHPVPGWQPDHVVTSAGNSDFEAFYFYTMSHETTATDALETIAREYADYRAPLCVRPTARSTHGSGCAIS